MADVLKNASIPNTMYKDDCGYCFETMLNPLVSADEKEPKHQLNTCLLCFQSFCCDHIDLHQNVVRGTLGISHDIYLNMYKVERSRPSEGTQEKKLKLEVHDRTEDELYETIWALIQVKEGKHSEICNSAQNGGGDPAVVNKVEQIIRAQSSGFQDMATSWQLEINPCKHINDFVEPENITLTGDTCGQCSLDSNLWLCLHCGHLGCGREQFGIDGNSHALLHYQSSDNSHPLAVKLGSLSSESSDVYCYACNDEVRFEEQSRLSNLLTKYGISLDHRVAKEKTLVELQVEQNSNWDFQMVNADGNRLKHLNSSKEYGCGLINLGNSCYMNSILQVLFNGGVIGWTLESLKEFPLDVVYPSTNLKCQLIKLRNAFKLNPESYQHGIKPSSLKKCVGEGHEEFSSPRQQDAMEFLTYFIDKLDKKIFGVGNKNPNDVIRFIVEDKLECSKCGFCKYTSQIAETLQVPLLKDEQTQDLLERLDDYFNGESLDIQCSKCKENTIILKSSKLKSAPSTLILNPTRIEWSNLAPVKTNSTLIVPGIRDEVLLSLEKYKAPEREFSEEYSSEDEEEAGVFQADEEKVASIVGMGFSKNAALRALYTTGNNNVEASLNWIFEHMEDPELNSQPIFSTAKRSRKFSVDSEALANMVTMGLDENLCRKGLVLNGGDVSRSVEWVFNNLDDDGKIEDELNEEAKGNVSSALKNVGFVDNFPEYRLTAVICHKGNSINSGHYVAFIKKEIDGGSKWVLYNDEKLVMADSIENLVEIEKNGYIYLFNRA